MIFKSKEQKLTALKRQLESLNAKYETAKERFEILDKDLEMAMDPDKHYEGKYIDKVANERDKAYNKKEHLRIQVCNIKCQILSLEADKADKQDYENNHDYEADEVEK